VKSAPVHRGAIRDTGSFAINFIEGRLIGFEKDIDICLTPIESKTREGVTYAYFPALAACCATLEYLTALYRGNIRSVGWQQVADFGDRYLPQPDYNRETVHVLFDAFRHPVAHRGIASGVWVEPHHGAGRRRRLTWTVTADDKQPSL
jgi:hypothetical protein